MAYTIYSIISAIANCYLIKAGDGFVMVDAGLSFSRGVLKKTLEANGCKPGDLKLIVLTHGDYDHTGNCAYLRKKLGARIAIHKNDAAAAETGNMLSARKNPITGILRFMMWLGGVLMAHRFKPDILLDGGADLSPYGFKVKIICTPGHTTGSISVLTEDGDLFCGDFLVGGHKPRINSLVDDAAEMAASVTLLKTLPVKTIYPGHGKPFTLDEFLKSNG